MPWLAIDLKKGSGLPPNDPGFELEGFPISEKATCTAQVAFLLRELYKVEFCFPRLDVLSCPLFESFHTIFYLGMSSLSGVGNPGDCWAIRVL
jgi:hypothetical protein